MAARSCRRRARHGGHQRLPPSPRSRHERSVKIDASVSPVVHAVEEGEEVVRDDIAQAPCFRHSRKRNFASISKLTDLSICRDLVFCELIASAEELWRLLVVHIWVQTRRVEKPRSESMYHPIGHFFKRGPQSSTNLFSDARPKDRSVCSKLKPCGVLQEMHRTALAWTLSENDARVNNVFFLLVKIIKSLPSGTAQHFARPSSTYC